MKLTKVIALPILLSMQFATFSGVVKAQEVDNLQSLCSKFPSNSQCKTYKASENISLDNRPGKKAKCLFSGDEKRKRCKVDVVNGQVNFYFETGKGLDVLEGEKDTKEVVIPVKTIKSLSYSKKSKINIPAVILLGLPGFLLPIKRSVVNIRYQQEGEHSQQQVVFVTRRKRGRKIRQELELQTDLPADISNLD